MNFQTMNTICYQDCTINSWVSKTFRQCATVSLKYGLTGDHQNLAKVCWYPQCWVYNGSGLDLGWWTEKAERFWEKRTNAILNDEVNNNLHVPLNVTEW
jgi:hypothetical protein